MGRSLTWAISENLSAVHLDGPAQLSEFLLYDPVDLPVLSTHMNLCIEVRDDKKAQGTGGYCM